MPITVEIPNRGSIEFADGTSDADIDAIVAKEFPPTQEDSYQKVLGYQQAASDEVPTKEEFLAYTEARKKKPLLGETPWKTAGAAAVETAKEIATLPYKAGEAIGQYIEPPEGVQPLDVAAATGAEIAYRSRLQAQNLLSGFGAFAVNQLEKIGANLKNDDDKYQAFLASSEIKRQLARAGMEGDQFVPASQELLKAYNISPEAISRPGVEAGGFAAAPENIAFAGVGKLASKALQQGAKFIPQAAGLVQRAGERIGTVARIPETQAGRAVTVLTGSEAAGQAVERAVATGTTGVTAAEAVGIPVSGTIGVPGLGTVSSVIGGAKAVGAGLETAGEAGVASTGAGLSPIQRGLLGFGERVAATEGASSTARALGTAIARTGLETPVKTAAKILVPATAAGLAGATLAGLTNEEGDALSAAFGSGFAFGGIDSGIRMSKAASMGAFNAERVLKTALDDLNTRPNEVQYTFVDSTSGTQETVTVKDRQARSDLYSRLDKNQLVKTLSEIANAENAGVDVILHKSTDQVPTGLQKMKYKGVALKPAATAGGRPTILVNVDVASPETLPHELLHARLTSDIVQRVGSQIINGIDDPKNLDAVNKDQFLDFAKRYAKAVKKAGDRKLAKQIGKDIATAFDPNLQRAQRVNALGLIADEFAAYYGQEMLAGKDPRSVLPGRIPSFLEAALNKAKESVSARFTQRALQQGFDPIARTFYDQNGKRIKIPWMEDAINQLVIKPKAFEPMEQRVDIRRMTPAQQNAMVLARGYTDLFVLNPDGSVGRPRTIGELEAAKQNLVSETIKLLDSLPKAQRESVSGLDAKGRPIIEGKLSKAEADALANSGLFSPSTSRYISDIAAAIQNQTLLNGSYWKVYGKTGKAGVFGESEKIFLPYKITINSEGGVNVKVVDWGKVQGRMTKALGKQAYKNLFRSYDDAMTTLRDVYLSNLAKDGAVPSAEALGGGVEGARKRNFFNEVMGSVPKKGDVMINEPTAGYTADRKGGSVYQDLRIERIQNVEDTGLTIPWSGDMGEKSSYRRTQLNFQPAENIGETSVLSDKNAGFRIMSRDGKFRLYDSSGKLSGIYDTEAQAKLKAEKAYATQTRIQPENIQQERQQGNARGQAAEASGRNRVQSAERSVQEGGQDVRPVRQDVTDETGGASQMQEPRYMPETFDEVPVYNLNELAKSGQLPDHLHIEEGTYGNSKHYRLVSKDGETLASSLELNGLKPKFNLLASIENEKRYESVLRAGDSGDSNLEASYSKAKTSREKRESLKSWEMRNPEATSLIRAKLNDMAERAGFIVKLLFHGTTKDFTKFDATKEGPHPVRDIVRTPQFFAQEYDMAEGYADYNLWKKMRDAEDAGKTRSAAYWRNKIKKADPRVMEVYVRADKLWDHENFVNLSSADNAGFDMARLEQGDWKYIEAPEFQQWLKDKGYDGFTTHEEGSKNIAIFDVNHIKSADIATFDNKGKLIPLSERFDTTKSDIRWMPDVQLQPDAAMPGAYNTTGGYRILPGKTAGRQRVYSSTGSLVGVAQSLEEAQRMIEKKLKLN